LALSAGLISLMPVASADPEKKERACFSAAETREKIVSHKLFEPFRLMQGAAARWQAEPIGARLCRWSDDLVYEISLLRRDGHVIHIFLNAQNGELVGSRNEPRNEPPRIEPRAEHIEPRNGR
ncbi:MAG TPA: hypothetical protein VEQ35_02085, partial [Beijerinckia sp.]|nr:hypothetical protein [Beijerinckia sp.]